jgi:hypothetical protein
LRHGGKIFERHGNAQQNKKGDSLDEGDGAKATDGGFEHDRPR